MHIDATELINASGNFDSRPDITIQKIVSEVLEIAPSLTTINAGIFIGPIQVEAGKIQIESILLNPGRKIAGYLRKAEAGAFFIATVGDGLEQLGQKELTTGDMLKGYYLDLLGSLTVEKAMDVFQKQFADELKQEGLCITNRYSPGYCDWNVSDQEHLFKLFNNSCCGVSLNDSALMQPMKSISGIIGIGKDVKFYQHSCEICNNESCIYRQVKSKGLY